jgi:hypothetical protein
MMKKSLLWALVVFLLAVSVCAQPTRRTDSTLTSSTAHIAALREQIRELTESTPSEVALAEACRQNCADANPQVRSDARASRRRREATIRRLVSEINHEVDAYISRVVDPNSVDPKKLKRIVEHLLVGAEVPAVFADDHLLMIAYMFGIGIRMGPFGTALAVRAYKASGGQFEFSDVTGRDMDGFARLAVQQLHSPTAGEVWLLASGYLTGANGPNNAMRVYAYNGSKFRTVWAPSTVWGSFRTTVTPKGFVVHGNYYRTDKRRYDTYVLNEQGVQRLEK